MIVTLLFKLYLMEKRKNKMELTLEVKELQSFQMDLTTILKSFSSDLPETEFKKIDQLSVEISSLVAGQIQFLLKAKQLNDSNPLLLIDKLEELKVLSNDLSVQKRISETIAVVEYLIDTNKFLS